MRGGGRFFCPTLASADDPPLDPAQTKHLFRVLRAEPGDRVILFDGRGTVAEVELVLPAPPARLRILRRWTEAPPSPRVVLAVPPLPPNRADLLAGKLTELGVWEVIPLLTQRRPPDLRARLNRTVARWRRLTIEAAKQCGNPWLPVLKEPRGLEELLRTLGDGVPLLAAHPGPGAQPIAEAAADARSGPAVAAVVGPEGDFTGEELAMLRERKARFVTLGPRVLRVETAALVLAAFLAPA